MSLLSAHNLLFFRRPLDLTSKYEQFLSDKVSKNYNLFFQKILKNDNLFANSNELLQAESALSEQEKEKESDGKEVKFGSCKKDKRNTVKDRSGLRWHET